MWVVEHVKQPTSSTRIIKSNLSSTNEICEIVVPDHAQWKFNFWTALKLKKKLYCWGIKACPVMEETSFWVIPFLKVVFKSSCFLHYPTLGDTDEQYTCLRNTPNLQATILEMISSHTMLRCQLKSCIILTLFRIVYKQYEIGNICMRSFPKWYRKNSSNEKLTCSESWTYNLWVVSPTPCLSLARWSKSKKTNCCDFEIPTTNTCSVGCWWL